MGPLVFGRASCAGLAIVSAALLACSPTEPSEFLDVSLRPEGDTVTSGGSGFVRVEATNRGSRAIEIEVETCPPRVLVHDSDGDRVGRPSVHCLLMLSAPVVLAPGETHVHLQGWLAQGADNGPLPPGTYRIRAFVVPVGGDPVLTNRVTVTVRAPA